MNGTTSSYLKEIKRQHESGTLTPEQATEFIVITLIEQATNGETLVNRLDELEKNMDERFDGLSTKIDKAVKHQEDHPSIIYLLRFKTKETIAAILFIFLILSSWFVSGFRQPILEFLGLPIF
jgi:hypothetical protein